MNAQEIIAALREVKLPDNSQRWGDALVKSGAFAPKTGISYWFDVDGDPSYSWTFKIRPIDQEIAYFIRIKCRRLIIPSSVWAFSVADCSGRGTLWREPIRVLLHEVLGLVIEEIKRHPPLEIGK